MRWNMQLGRTKSELESSTKSPLRNVCLACFVKTIAIKKDSFEQFQACCDGGKACQRVKTQRSDVGKNIEWPRIDRSKILTRGWFTFMIPEPPVPEPPVQILQPPVPQPVQIHELDNLEPTLTDAASLDQLMSFAFGEELAPPAYTQKPQLLSIVPSIFDGNNDLISFLDEFERKLGMETVDLRTPRLNPCVKKSIGFKAIQPMDMSCN
ncbi:hypothetical protein TNCV_875031 [Trichonephila clavipes]|nr:hypothetical protein TNCV_875031 [Trichonephila clavipes]